MSRVAQVAVQKANKPGRGVACWSAFAVWGARVVSQEAVQKAFFMVSVQNCAIRQVSAAKSVGCRRVARTTSSDGK